MDIRIHSQVAVFIFILYSVHVHSGLVQNRDEEDILIDLTKESSQKTVAKRSTDWSKKISESSAQTSPSPPLERNDGDITTKPPQMVRRVRIHNGAQKIRQDQKGDVTDVNPGTGSEGNGAKVVRVKKFRRKLKKKTTTATPDIVTSTIYSSTVLPQIPTEPGYSHITVINKEVNNPKRNRNRKNKKPLNPAQSTVTYNSEAKQNGMTHVTTFPEIHHSEMLLFNKPTSFPDFGGYFTGSQAATSPRNQQNVLYPQRLSNQQNTSPMQDNLFHFGHVFPWTTQTPANDESNMFGQHALTHRKPSVQFPSYYQSPYFSSGQQIKLPASRGDLTNPENAKNPMEVEGQIEKTSISGRSGNTATTSASTANPDTLTTRHNVNQTDANAYTKVVDDSTPTQVPANQNDGTSLRNGYPLLYSNFPYNQQNAFADPFFNTHNLPNNRPVQPLQMPPVHLPFSPFYSSSDPESEEYVFAPYQSSGMIIPGFHHSPQLRSLRRTILDQDEDGTTTNIPVTPFSLPKFEIPAIDFNDKGCQTIYKEVKSVPGVRSRSEGNAKSFVISRECYFPNGLPTKRQTESETTEAPQITQAMSNSDSSTSLESKDPK